MTRSPAIYKVTPTGTGDWTVREGDGGRSKSYATQSEAIDAARAAARCKGGQLVVQSSSGQAKASFTLGRSAMEKLNAVEGVTLTEEAKQAFARFDREGVGADERRASIRSSFDPKAKS